MLANIQDLTSFKNHLLNNEIGEAKSLLARKQAAFKDVTRAVKVTLETAHFSHTSFVAKISWEYLLVLA